MSSIPTSCTQTESTVLPSPVATLWKKFRDMKLDQNDMVFSHIFKFLFLNNNIWIYRTVFRPRKGVLKSLNIAAQRLLRLLGSIVGSELVDAVVNFFADFEGIDVGFSERVHTIDQ